jgi:3'(2'), 5'-bisphosphate nucleotidase
MAAVYRRAKVGHSPRMDREAVITTARRLALEAGEAILDVYERPDFAVSAKADATPLTEADERADRLIATGLRRAFPDIPVVTEEQAATHGIEAGTFFLVDPLDGTKEFVQRRGDFTVNIALIEAGEPRLGVIFAPAKRRLFYTRADGGAVEEEGDLDPLRPGPTRSLAVSRPDNAGLLVVASKSHRDQATDDYIARYRVRDLRSAGSSLKFCLVAAGEADLYPRLGRTMEWDTAAGHAILAAAGGRVVRYEDHAPLRYGKPGYANPFFIAHAPGVTLVRA